VNPAKRICVDAVLGYTPHPEPQLIARENI